VGADACRAASAKIGHRQHKNSTGATSKKLITWRFDPQKAAIRKFHKGSTVEQILERGDEILTAAVFPPESTRKARKIYNFLLANSNLTTMVSGMAVFATGMDRAKLAIVAKEYGIEMSRYLNLIDLYENEMLKDQERKNKD
jgi:hypothetical protein